MSAANRIVRAVVTAAVGLAVLSGCIRLEGELTVNGTASEAPDTVSGTMVVAVSDEWAISQGEDPTNLSDAIAEELAANPGAGVTGEPYAADGYTGTTFTFAELPIERLSWSTDGALTITREGDTYVVRGDLSVLNPDPDAEDPGEYWPWTAHVSITMPEEVTQHNGTLEGRTVTWDLDETSADPTMLAVSSVGPVSWVTRVPTALWVLVALAGVGAVVAWWFSRRHQRQETSDDGGFRARQARARGASTSKLDDMLAEARHDIRKKGR